MVSYVVYKERLQGEVRTTFEKVETYAQVMNIPETVREEMMAELLDLLYEAQQRGDRVSDMIGEDVERFCKEYFCMNHPIRNTFLQLVGVFYRCAWIALVLCMLDVFVWSEGAKTIWTATTGLGPVVIGILIGMISGIPFILIMRMLLFRWKKLTNNLFLLLDIVYSVFVLIVLLPTCMSKMIMFTCRVAPVMIGCILYIVVYHAVRLRRRYHRYGTIRRPADRVTMKDTMHHIWNDTTRETQYDLLDMLIKGYENKNKRLCKYGKEPVSPEAFTEKVRKKEKYAKANKWIYSVMYVVIVVGCSFTIFRESFVDGLIFFLILAVLEFFLFRFFYKTDQAGCQRRAELIAQCDQEGITLVELHKRVHTGQDDVNINE